MGGANADKPSVQSITVTMSSNTIETLREESNLHNQNLNSIINRILKFHFARSRYHSDSSPYISVSKHTIKKMLEKFDENDIYLISEEYCKNSVAEIIFELGKEYAFETVLDVVESILHISGFSFKRYRQGLRYCYLIRHDMGIKGSFFLAHICRFVFNNFGIKDFHFDRVENNLYFEAYIQWNGEEIE